MEGVMKTLDQKIEVMQAALDGKEIEYCYFRGGVKWVELVQALLPPEKKYHKKRFDNRHVLCYT